jgi:hypothetical protein
MYTFYYGFGIETETLESLPMTPATLEELAVTYDRWNYSRDHSDMFLLVAQDGTLLDNTEIHTLFYIGDCMNCMRPQEHCECN